MHLEHKAGEKLFIDFAGSKLYWTDIPTSQIIEAEVFVATLAVVSLPMWKPSLRSAKPTF